MSTACHEELTIIGRILFKSPVCSRYTHKRRRRTSDLRRLRLWEVCIIESAVVAFMPGISQVSLVAQSLIIRVCIERCAQNKISKTVACDDDVLALRQSFAVSETRIVVFWGRVAQQGAPAIPKRAPSHSAIHSTSARPVSTNQRSSMLQPPQHTS
jgi:hypothetical protein